VVCGVCGRRMTVRYHVRHNRSWPDYVCQREAVDTATSKCQFIPGSGIDHAVGELLVQTVTAVTLEVALHVQAEIEARADEADALRRQRVERARYEADLARRRFMEADPGNRLVVDVLEAEWNSRLRALHDAQEEIERRRAEDHRKLDPDRRKEILALAVDFPRLWNDPKTPQRERKRMVRLLLEDVTLTKGVAVHAGVRFRGGATQSLTLPLAQTAWQLRKTTAEVVAAIDTLLDKHAESQIARILNERGHVSGEGRPFHRLVVQKLRRAYGLKTRYDRLRDAGMLTLTEMADRLGIAAQTVKKWRDQGLVQACVCNDKNECLYEPLGEDPPAKNQGTKLSKRRRFPEVASNRAKEVQCGA
jgi:hypothetical protein